MPAFLVLISIFVLVAFMDACDFMFDLLVFDLFADIILHCSLFIFNLLIELLLFTYLLFSFFTYCITTLFLYMACLAHFWSHFYLTFKYHLPHFLCFFVLMFQHRPVLFLFMAKNKLSLPIRKWNLRCALKHEEAWHLERHSQPWYSWSSSTQICRKYPTSTVFSRNHLWSFLETSNSVAGILGSNVRKMDIFFSWQILTYVLAPETFLRAHHYGNQNLKLEVVRE